MAEEGPQIHRVGKVRIQMEEERIFLEMEQLIKVEEVEVRMVAGPVGTEVPVS